MQIRLFTLIFFYLFGLFFQAKPIFAFSEIRAPLYPEFRGLIALPKQTSRPVRLLFVGDIMVHKEQLLAAQTSHQDKYDFQDQFRFIKSFLKGDLLIGNFETVLAGPLPGYSGYPSFNTPDTLADALKDVGFDVLLLANNHILDKNAVGALRTRHILDKKGFAVTGLFSEKENTMVPLLMTVEGLLVGIMNYTYGSNRSPTQVKGIHLNIINKAHLEKDIQYLRAAGADILIATFHWGIEYQEQPSQAQKKIAAFCLEKGVDLVIGTHPHILQPIEIHTSKNKPQCIAWSLGNFISCQRTLPRERSIILAVDFTQDTTSGHFEVCRIAVLPTWVQMQRMKSSHDITVRPAFDQEKGPHALINKQELSPHLAAHLHKIHKEILTFLHISGFPDENGFYELNGFP